MTTATAEDPAADEAFSERELRKQEETLRDLREETIPRLEDRVDELEDEIATAVEAGEDPSDLRDELDRVERDLELYRGAAPELARRIRARRRRKVRREAGELLETIKKAAGGIAGEQPRHVDRFADHLAKARAALEAAARARVRGRVLGRVADVLADEFDLDRPDLRDVPSPSGYDEVADAASWRPSSTLKSWDRRTKGVSMTARDEPAAALRRLAAIDVDVDAVGEAVDLLEGLRDLTAEEGEG